MPQVGAFVFSNAKKVYIIQGTAVTCYYLGLNRPCFSSTEKYVSLVLEVDLGRLQNSPYFYLFKYARTVKQKVWSEAEIERAL